MYAIARSGGKQFKIQPECVIRVPSLGSKVGDKVKLEEILLVADGENVQVGKPLVDGAYAEATVVRHGKDAKIRIIKYKRRKDYHRTLGHRQGFTELEIGKIVLGAKKAAKAETPKVQDAAAAEPVKAAAETKPVAESKPAAEKKTAAAETKKTAAKAPAEKKAAAKKSEEKPKKEAAKKTASKPKKAAAPKAKKPAADSPAAQDDSEKS